MLSSEWLSGLGGTVNKHVLHGTWKQNSDQKGHRSGLGMRLKNWPERNLWLWVVVSSLSLKEFKKLLVAERQYRKWIGALGGKLEHAPSLAPSNPGSVPSPLLTRSYKETQLNLPPDSKSSLGTSTPWDLWSLFPTSFLNDEGTWPEGIDWCSQGLSYPLAKVSF